MNTYYKLMRLAFLESKQDSQLKLLIIILTCIISLLKLSFLTQFTAHSLLTNDIDTISKSALYGIISLVICVGCIFSICFFIVNFMRLQDSFLLIKLLKTMGYQNSQITFYISIVWLCYILFCLLFFDIVILTFGHWLIYEFSLVPNNQLIIIHTILCSDLFFITYSGVFLLISHVLISKFNI